MLTAHVDLIEVVTKGTTMLVVDLCAVRPAANQCLHTPINPLYTRSWLNVLLTTPTHTTLSSGCPHPSLHDHPLHHLPVAVGSQPYYKDTCVALGRGPRPDGCCRSPALCQLQTSIDTQEMIHRNCCTQCTHWGTAQGRVGSFITRRCTGGRNRLCFFWRIVVLGT